MQMPALRPTALADDADALLQIVFSRLRLNKLARSLGARLELEWHACLLIPVIPCFKKACLGYFIRFVIFPLFFYRGLLVRIWPGSTSE